MKIFTNRVWLYNIASPSLVCWGSYIRWAGGEQGKSQEETSVGKEGGKERVSKKEEQALTIWHAHRNFKTGCRAEYPNRGNVYQMKHPCFDLSWNVVLFGKNPFSFILIKERNLSLPVNKDKTITIMLTPSQWENSVGNCACYLLLAWLHILKGIWQNN